MYTRIIYSFPYLFLRIDVKQHLKYYFANENNGIVRSNVVFEILLNLTLYVQDQNHIIIIISFVMIFFDMTDENCQREDEDEIPTVYIFNYYILDNKNPC